MRTPVAVFGYSRASELQRALGSLAACRGFAGRPVHLFLDAAKGERDAEGVADVRALADSLDWPNLTVHKADRNRGLRASVLQGVSQLVDAYGAAIVIEDDLLLSPAALEYFDAGLAAYAAEERVKAICGYMYKLEPPTMRTEAFFLPFASSWGWATWKRAWDPFIAELAGLTAKARDRDFLRRFDRQGIIAASTMLKAQDEGLIDSWAILWNAHITEADGVALFPPETMILNGGFASEGATHSSRGNPINRVLIRLSEGRGFGDAFSLPAEVQIDEPMRRRIADSWESRLHRLSARLGRWRRAARRRPATRRVRGSMRLLMVTPWVSRQGGGVAEAVRLLARLMSARPEVLVEVLSVREHGENIRLSDWGEATISTYRYFGPSNYRFSPGLFWRLLTSDPDIVHVHGVWTFQCLAVLIWSLLTGKPYVVSPHGMLEEWILARSRRLKAAVSWLYQTRFLERAAAFHVLTEKERRDVARFAPRRATHIVPNFVERAAPGQGKPHWWRPDFEGATVYLYLGRIHEKKGWRELCEAWGSICAADASFARDSRLVFCGWLDDSPQFESVVGELVEHYGNVLFAGPQFGAARAQSLAAASAFILPSRSEGLPMVVLEAWAAGVPVLMTRECNLPVGFETGAAIEIGWSKEDIAKGLRQFADLPATEQMALGAAGLALVEDRFSSAHASEAMAGMYESCLGRSAVVVEGEAVQAARDLP